MMTRAVSPATADYAQRAAPQRDPLGSNPPYSFRHAASPRSRPRLNPSRAFGD
jgi:hypothetical protein